jgi:VanZ family protein
VLLTAVTIGVIVYGSLYPFEFRVPVEGDGAVSALLCSWATAPGRGDFLANILLYMPLGWFGILSLPQRISIGLRLLLMIIGGTTLSVSMELIQYFDADRVTSADDVYANLLGTILGGLGATCLFGRLPVPLIAKISGEPIPAMLLAAWAGYRLYPYVPTIDLHKYWNALKPIILEPTLPIEGLYRHTTIWLTTFTLISALVGRRRSAMLAPLFCGCIMGARIMIVGTTLSVAEVAGAAAAVCLWPAMLALSQRRRAALLFMLLGAGVIAERLQPFQFQPVARDFGWVPFRSLMAGSIAVDVISFFEKSFLYGSLLYLFTEAGGRLHIAVLIVGGALLATSWAETYLPGRSAEITDLTMALLLAGSFALLRVRHQVVRTDTGKLQPNPPERINA